MLFYYLVQSRLNDCELEKFELASVVIYDIFVWFPALAALQQTVFKINYQVSMAGFCSIAGQFVIAVKGGS